MNSSLSRAVRTKRGLPQTLRRPEKRPPADEQKNHDVNRMKTSARAKARLAYVANIMFDWCGKPEIKKHAGYKSFAE